MEPYPRAFSLCPHQSSLSRVSNRSTQQIAGSLQKAICDWSRVGRVVTTRDQLLWKGETDRVTAVWNRRGRAVALLRRQHGFALHPSLG